MSANNQILIKEHKGKWLVFNDVNAESWGDGKNKLQSASADFACETRDEAYEKACQLEADSDYEIEYGVQFNRLCKDDAEVEIFD